MKAELKEWAGTTEIISSVPGSGRCKGCDKQNTDWICISGENAGPIAAKTSDKDLKRIFGEKNITSSKELVAEGTKEIIATYNL